jgi:hypothetical protein
MDRAANTWTGSATVEVSRKRNLGENMLGHGGVPFRRDFHLKIRERHHDTLDRVPQQSSAVEIVSLTVRSKQTKTLDSK